MNEIKSKVLKSISDMLQDRMAGRLKPKAAAVEIEVSHDGSKEDGPGLDGSAEHEGAESAAYEKKEGMMDPTAEKAEKMGGDISKLSDEEKEQLESLYQKMGC